MNIYTSAYYMKQGYKIRRPNWAIGEFIFDICGVIEKCFVEHDAQSSLGDWFPYTEDLLATDWELFIEE